MRSAAYKEIIGKTLESFNINGSEEIQFEFKDGSRYAMSHNQSCCEQVYIDWYDEQQLNQLVGKEINYFDEDFEDGETEYGDHLTITKYTIGSNELTVKIIWHGSSNGYYSETPEFYKIK